MLVVYLGFDFLVVASSMTVMFFLPILGYRSIVLPAKRVWSARIDELMSQAGVFEISRGVNIEDPVARRILPLLVLSTQVRDIKDWPLSLGTSMRFVLSYVIPVAGFIARLIFYAIGAQVPL